MENNILYSKFSEKNNNKDDKGKSLAKSITKRLLEKYKPNTVPLSIGVTQNKQEQNRAA